VCCSLKKKKCKHRDVMEYFVSHLFNVLQILIKRNFVMEILCLDLAWVVLSHCFGIIVPLWRVCVCIDASDHKNFFNAGRYQRTLSRRYPSAERANLDGL